MYIKGLQENWDVEVASRRGITIYSLQLNLRTIKKHKSYSTVRRGLIEKVLNIKQ